MVVTNEVISIICIGDKVWEDFGVIYLNYVLLWQVQVKLVIFFVILINMIVELLSELVVQFLIWEEVDVMNYFDWLWMGEMLDLWIE